jgi:UDP-N-acetylglucosamine--N-acetylmuramyl-(pentapeptide) pyrophosphoryl-undecaprenol N-acetylglucosamine transferase
VKVMLAAGGSAGHVEPALTLADTLCHEDPQTQIVALGTHSGIEARLIPQRGYRMIEVPAYPFPRRPNRQALTAPFRIGGSVRAVTKVLRAEQPDVVVGFGGYVAFPAYVAARRLGIPIVVHEANAHPGLADRVGARLTPWVAVNTEGVLPHSARIGMPLRPAIRELAMMNPQERAQARAAARTSFGLDENRRTLLVFGGSLGARRINATMAQAAELFTAVDIQVIHLVGSAGHGLPQQWPPNRASDQPAYLSLAYLSDMQRAYAAADAVVCRAGAMTCAEVAAIGAPAVYVPLPVGNGEQMLNAQPVVSAGGGIVIDDREFDPRAIREQVIPLVVDGHRCEQMGAVANTFAVIDADARLADMVRSAAHLRGRGSALTRDGRQ